MRRSPCYAAGYALNRHVGAGSVWTQGHRDV